VEAKRREKQEKKKIRRVFVFYCADSTATKKTAYELAEEWDDLDPIVSALNASTIEQCLSGKVSSSLASMADFPILIPLFSRRRLSTL